jgi:hypothetical protein
MVPGKDWLALLGHDEDHKPRETYVRKEKGRPPRNSWRTAWPRGLSVLPICPMA